MLSSRKDPVQYVHIGFSCGMCSIEFSMMCGLGDIEKRASRFIMEVYIMTLILS